MIRARIWIGFGVWFCAALGAAQTPGLLDDRRVLEGFVDGVMARERASGRMIGASVAIVKDGRTLLAKGYGMADRAAGRGANGERTLFRVGSISKALIWIAVAQQVQEGHLALDDEVNDRLTDVQIPDSFPVPITVDHLLTHSAGFEARLIGLFAGGRRTVGTFQERLESMRALRVEMPGRHAVYSNYGAALAARLVESSSGQSWDDYVERRIFEPLGMTRTTTRQPPPAPLDEAVAQGYRLTAGGPRRQAFEYVTLAPVGSASSTAADMARLSIELLRNDDTPVLDGRGRRMLNQPGLANDPRLNRMLHGFYQRDSHGQRIIGQHGEMLSFRSDLLLYPDLGLGLFISFNSDDGRLPARFTEAFNDQLFGRVRYEGEQSGKGAEAFRGFYASLRVPHSTAGKLYRYVDLLEVSVDPEGRVSIDGLGGADGSVRLVELEPEVFGAADGNTRLAFSAGSDGAMRLAIDAHPYLAYERLPGWLTPPAQLGALGLAGLLMLGVVIWPLSAMQHTAIGRSRVRGERFATVLAVITVGTLTGFFVVLAQALGDLDALAVGLPQRLANALWLPVIAAPLVIVQLFLVMRAWAQSFWWPSRRIHYTLVTLASGLLIGWCAYWNLVAVTPAMLAGLR